MAGIIVLRAGLGGATMAHELKAAPGSAHIVAAAQRARGISGPHGRDGARVNSSQASIAFVGSGMES